MNKGQGAIQAAPAAAANNRFEKNAFQDIVLRDLWTPSWMSPGVPGSADCAALQVGSYLGTRAAMSTSAGRRQAPNYGTPNLVGSERSTYISRRRSTDHRPSL